MKLKTALALLLCFFSAALLADVPIILGSGKAGLRPAIKKAIVLVQAQEECTEPTEASWGHVPREINIPNAIGIAFRVTCLVNDLPLSKFDNFLVMEGKNERKFVFRQMKDEFLTAALVRYRGAKLILEDYHPQVVAYVEGAIDLIASQIECAKPMEASFGNAEREITRSGMSGRVIRVKCVVYDLADQRHETFWVSPENFERSNIFRETLREYLSGEPGPS